MKEFKSRVATKLLWSVFGICTGYFLYNLTSFITNNFLIAGTVGAVTILGFFFKNFYIDNISIIISDDKKLVVKRFGKAVRIYNIEKYNWSEYSMYWPTKNVEDQDIYYVDKENNMEEYIDASNFSHEDYEEILNILGAKGTDTEPIKVETIKK